MSIVEAHNGIPIRGDNMMRPERGRFRQALISLWRKPVGFISLIVLIVIVFASFGAAVVTPYGIDESTGRFAAAPSLETWFGTDQLGRDVLTRTLYGGQTSLTVGILSVLVGISLGTLVGILSGYFIGWVDKVLQRIIDVMMAVPGILLALTIVAAFGAGVTNVTLAISVGVVPRVARVVRGSTLAIRSQPYIEAARSLGARSSRILFRHVLVNIAAPIIVLASIQLGVAIVAEASLSFLGLGVPMNVPTWGNMLNGAGLRFMTRAPWMAIAPGAVLTLTVLSVNLFGDSLRDILDPRLRGR